MARLVVLGTLTRLKRMEKPQELPGKYLLLSVAASGDSRTPSSIALAAWTSPT